MVEGTVSDMLQNHEADSWDDTARFGERSDTEQALLDRADDPTLPKLDRLDAYVDYCFERYPIVSDVLDRDQIQTAIADWGQRRGQCKYNARMAKRKFPKRVLDSKYRNRKSGHYAVFMAEALIGIPPEDDKGVGWKPTVRHELGHAIDYERRGTSNHDSTFKAVMRKFGEEANDGMSQSGYKPRVFR